MHTKLLLVAFCALSSAAALAQDICEPLRYGPPGEPPATKYATSVATNGRFWFVGDRAARTVCASTALGCQGGAVHVYELVDGALELVQTIVPPDVTSGSNFGVSLDADGDRLIVGAPYFRLSTGEGRGAVFVYEFDGKGWVERARVPPPPDIPDFYFGNTVVLHGNDMVVWPNHAFDRVYSYRYDDGVWSLIESIWQDTPSQNWFFGQRMAISEQWLFVGAHRDDTIAPGGGSVFIYQRQPDGTVAFMQKLAADVPSLFGDDVAFDGETLFVGAPGHSFVYSAQGGVFTYQLVDEEWRRLQTLTHSAPRNNNGFGSYLAVHRDMLLASSSLQSTPEGLGATYLFEVDPAGEWSETTRLVPNPTRSTSAFGSALAMAGDYALVGSLDEYGFPDESGAAYLFDLSCRTCEADLDADGSLTVFDFLLFLNLFQDGDMLADFDGDGELSIFDFLAFQTAFDTGCE